MRVSTVNVHLGEEQVDNFIPDHPSGGISLHSEISTMSMSEKVGYLVVGISHSSERLPRDGYSQGRCSVSLALRTEREPRLENRGSLQGLL